MGATDWKACNVQSKHRGAGVKRVVLRIRSCRTGKHRDEPALVGEALGRLCKQREHADKVKVGLQNGFNWGMWTRCTCPVGLTTHMRVDHVGLFLRALTDALPNQSGAAKQ